MDFFNHTQKTWHDDTVPRLHQLNHAVLGLVAESAEVAELFTKAMYKPCHGLVMDQFADELGDVLYHVRVIADLMELDLSNIERKNREKLSDGHGWQRDYYHQFDV